MQSNVSRFASTLRALTNGAGSQQLPVTQLVTISSVHGHAGLGPQAGGPLPWAPLRYPVSSGVCNMSTSTPDKHEETTKSQSESTTGPEASRPTFTARLRDLLAVSSWRISKGEVGRLAGVKEDLASVTAAAAAAQTEAPGQAAAAAAAAAAVEALQASGSAAPDVNGGDDGTLQLQLQQQQQQDLKKEPQQQQKQQEQRLLHPKYGYSALGGVVPFDEGPSTATGLVGMLTSQNPRVNPRRRFMPGETYEPQDLNPFAPRAQGRTRPDVGAVRRPSAAEVMEKADYKNVAFLSRWFLSPAGRLLSRKQTRLPVGVHRYVSRQIKLARHMGLMAGEARLDKLHLARLREQELVEAQRRAAAAAAAVAGTTSNPAAVAAAAAGTATEGAGGATTVVVAVGGRAGTRLKELADLGT
ncbi:hypothetical protein Vretimale_10160 [Volvox reticuliferus]|uniref:Small ribosomal subunit protein bS18c n=1 Tax=Volvox reticuliferus TaxID=1737510 RepID=A0A8J4FBV8_9CHLO|nr:hypothetical protein Vretifemale_606 [Volvox reticuliferus]GIM05722.1 hypothetical protein Vretimale_10160 [Volvox reticuliferus]